MRERLVALLIGVTITVLALYGVPRAYFLADLVRDQQEREVEHTVATVAAALAVQEENQVPVTRSFLAATLGEDDTVEYVSPDGTSTSAGGPATSQDSDIVRTAEVPGGGLVTLTRSGDMVAQRVADAIMPLVLLGLALLLASALAGLRIARRVSRPFQELADLATALGHGRFDQKVPHYSIPEAEAIGEALRVSSAQLERLVRREREFTVNASHELLTPITALNLELEDLKAWPETPPSVAEQLEVSLDALGRLAATVQELLAQERSTTRAGTLHVDLAALTEHVVQRWRPIAASQGREMRLESPGVVPARIVPDEFTQVLDVLLDNACRHGRGTVVVECAELDTHLRVRVCDEGRSSAESNVLHRRNDGPAAAASSLGRAAELAEAQGGYLVHEDSATTRFALMLPKPAPS